MKKLKLKYLVVGTALLTVFAFVGCTSKKSEQPKSQSKIEQNVEKKQAALTIGEGTKNMRDVLKEMKADISAKQDDAASKVGAKLEENWSVIEDSVKVKNKALYGKVEDPLDTINAAIKVKPLDTKTVLAQIDTLDKVLADVQKIK